MAVRPQKTYPLVKLHRPVIQNAFHREPLFKRLADKDKTRPLIWIGGPAGSGKTVLISSYIQKNDLDCIWYQLDHTDKESSNIFHYLRIAAMQQASVPNHELPVFDPLSRMSIEDFGPIFFEHLFLQIPSPIILVFDNCEFLPDDSDIYQAILSCLSRIKPSVRIIMISRKNLPPIFQPASQSVWLV